MNSQVLGKMVKPEKFTSGFSSEQLIAEWREYNEMHGVKSGADGR